MAYPTKINSLIELLQMEGKAKASNACSCPSRQPRAETESAENATLAEYPAEEIAAVGQTLMNQVEGETCGRIAAAGGLLLRGPGREDIGWRRTALLPWKFQEGPGVLQHVGGFSVSYGFV